MTQLIKERGMRRTLEESLEVHFPEVVKVVTDAHCVDLPGGRGEMNSAIETGSDIYLARALGRSESLKQFLKDSYTQNLRRIFPLWIF